MLPPPGEIIEVDGVSLHIESRGSGRPCVVLDSGAGGFTPYWSLVTQEVETFSTVFNWDRPGLGWSGTDAKPRDIDRIVSLLRAALEGKGIDPPFVLVGHSLGGMHVRRFAMQYPNEVAGLVLVDPHTEEMGQISLQTLKMIPFLTLSKIAKALGRIFGKHVDSSPDPLAGLELDKLPPAAVDALKQIIATEAYQSARAADSASAESSRQTMRETAAVEFPQVPLVVISSTGKELESMPRSVRLGMTPKKMARLLERYHRPLSDLSSKGRWIQAYGSTHHVPVDAPQLIVRAIREVIEESRGS